MAVERCKRCNRMFQFSNDTGYSREYCGPLCDGSDHGRKYAIHLINELAEYLRYINYDENTERLQAWELIDSRLQEICRKLRT